MNLLKACSSVLVLILLWTIADVEFEGKTSGISTASPNASTWVCLAAPHASTGVNIAGATVCTHSYHIGSVSVGEGVGMVSASAGAKNKYINHAPRVCDAGHTQAVKLDVERH